MTQYEIVPQHETAYSRYSPHSEPPWTLYRPAPYTAWAAKNASLPLEKDAGTLADMLAPVYLPLDAPVHDQVFGTQSRKLKFSLEHIVNLLNERAKLHKRHLEDINHRHMQIQGELFGARLHGRLDGYRRATRVQQTLLQLDEQRRREELAFWKDTAELRNALFEHAAEYQTLRHRTALLSGVDLGGAVDG